MTTSMRWCRSIGAAAAAWALAGGCAGRSSDAGSDSQESSVSQESSDSQESSVRRTPEKHRAAAIACDDQRPPGDPPPRNQMPAQPCAEDDDCAAPEHCNGCRVGCVDSGAGPLCVAAYGQCLEDADCSQGINGRCEGFRSGFQCTYDECGADADCTSGGPCACAGRLGSDANTCLLGNCRTDADCAGGTGYCSPTFGDCGNYSGVIAYYCHTPADTCIDDADCAGSATQSPGYCMYRPELGRWECGYGQCVG